MRIGLGALLLAAAVLPASRGFAAGEVPALHPGDSVPPFDTVAVDGSPRRVEFSRSGPPTVLLFFLSSCPTCHRMIPEWNRAYGRRPKNLRVLGVVLDQAPPGFFQILGISFPVVQAPGREILHDAYKILRVPVTLRVAPGGRVEDVAQGIVDPIRLGEIFRP